MGNDLKRIKTALVYVGVTQSYYGFRRIAAIAAKSSDCKIYIVQPAEMRSLISMLKGTDSEKAFFSDDDVQMIAHALGQADLVAVSSMTGEADLVKKILKAVKDSYPDTFLLWGGIHPITAPDDAMESSVDAICTGEGEASFADFLEYFHNKDELFQLRNFWFRDSDHIIKNPLRALLTNDELSSYPRPIYGAKESIFIRKVGFRPLTEKDYRAGNALSYNTIWTRGCPFKCSYCANNSFLDKDPGAGRVRYSSVDYIISEIKEVIKDKPYIQVISFFDDCFLQLDIETIRQFSQRWGSEIGLSFVVHGVTPVHIHKEKMELLLDAGMNRIRMGVQSGSDRILKFYKRPNRKGLIADALKVISTIQGRMIPTAYDIILDNPIEEKDDVDATIRLVNNFPRPFTINFYSLRIMPGTPIEAQLRTLEKEGKPLASGNYDDVTPTFANILLYVAATVKIPEVILNRLLVYAHPYLKKQPYMPNLLFVVKLAFYVKRAFQHMRHLDFSVIFGEIGWLLWKVKILKPSRVRTK